MTPKKQAKNPQENQNKNPQENQPEENSVSDTENTKIVDTIIEEHAEPKQPSITSKLLDNAMKNLQGSDDSKPAKKKVSKTTEWRRKKAAKEQEDEEYITTFVATLLTIGLSAWSVPEDLKPNEDEVNGLSDISTRLLLRHVSLTGKLTQDAIDVIGILAIVASYYTRTSQSWAEYSETRKAQKEQEKEPEPFKYPMAEGLANV